MELTPEQNKYIAKLYKNMYLQLYTYGYGILCDQYLSEEAVQETFRIACHRTDDLMTCLNPKGWIAGTLKYVIRNTLRKRAALEKQNAAADELDITVGVCKKCVQWARKSFRQRNMAVTLDRKKLRAIRKEKELTQEELAECSAISDRYIRRLETGAAEPSASVLYRLSQVLEVPMDELMIVTGEEPNA